MGSDVEIHVLGSTRATVAGEPADLGGPRQRAVLARLVVEGGRVVSTDRLVDDLWDGEPPPKALGALQVHVSHLRRSLEPGRAPRQPASVLVSAPPGYALRLPRATVDAWRFEDLLNGAGALVDPRERRARLAQALACWSGPAFAESTDTAWAGPEAARLEELRRSAVERAAAADLEAGEVGRAVADLERHVHDHPAREEAVRLLALALYRSGRQGDALGVLRSLRAHLADELGVDPSPALRALEADVLAQSASLDARPPPPSSSSSSSSFSSSLPVEVTTQPALEPVAGAPVPAQDDDALGRAREVAQVLAAGEEAQRTGAARLVWLAGEAGDGKTTLLASLVSAAAARGWTTAWGRCPEVDGAPPGWAWQEVLDDVEAGELTELAATTSPFLLARAVARQLAERAGRAPVLVVLDDVHRADGLTLQLLRQVVDHLDESPVLVVAAFRPSESGIELGAARAALAAATAGHVELEGLPREAVAALARRSGLVGPADPDAPDPELVDLLLTRTGGRPLFVRELSRLLAARGPAVVRSLLHGRGEVTVPAGVADVLRARLARLPGPSLTTLRQAAVLGRRVRVDVLAELSGRDIDDVLDALEAPVLAGMLDQPAPGAVGFTHALVRDVLYEDTPVLRRTRLHAAAVDVYERLAPHDVAALAHHAGASLSPATAARALGHLRAAARAATAVGAPAEAAALYTTALRAQELLPADHPDRSAEARVALRVEAVTAAARAGNAAGARQCQVETLDLARATGRRDLILAVVTAWRTPLVWTIRDVTAPPTGLREAAEELLASPDITGADRVRLHVAHFLESEGGDLDAEIAISAEALREARALVREHERQGGSAEDPEVLTTLCAALNIRTYAALGPRLADQRAALARELIETATRAASSDYLATGHWMLFMASAAVGDLRAADREVRAALELCASGQLGQLLGVLAVWRSVTEALAGRYDAALARWDAAIDGLSELGGVNTQLMTALGRVMVECARGGDLGVLADQLQEIDRMSGGEFAPPAALALARAGRMDEARQSLAGAVQPRRGYYWLALNTMWAHAAVAVGDRAEAARLAELLRPWAGRVAGIDSGSLPIGPVDDALAECAALLGDDAAAERHRQAARQVRAALHASAAEAGLL
ncbi:Transcriptional regulatory protein, C terminal [Quadrisphaera granulorum]|uniref:Transcriptional regulator n=1 Tax=Quadrisphaera granulorum TaxID=317664 RepID=A0A316ACQ4_9ACTN|nr:BTAD domain-containing putative transcriptional regulator [Quadrisphaera granulorum]PWJ55362.1 transcriptional regulator [Quadrisphaera granulorum]SZE95426.1 Transcriptional regulatory protein, C terminal [Quadrisphaera granulorum]